MNQIKNQNRIIGIISAIIFLFACGLAQAQHSLELTFRPAANFPVKDFGETKLNNCGGFEAAFAYRFMPHLAAYGGWGWNIFTEKESTAESQNQFNETGYTFGLRFVHPFALESKLNFIVSGGGIYNHVEIENKEGDIVYDTGHGFGWQAEAGVAIPVGHHDRWHLDPTVRYSALPTDITTDGIESHADLNYFSVGLGVTWTLVKHE